MDFLLGKVTQQAMNYAIRSGVTLTATYAIKQSSKLLNNAPKGTAKDELSELQQRLFHKIRIVSPAIDMIELIAARGNTSLESAVLLTKELRLGIERLGQRLTTAAASSVEYKTGSTRAKATLKVENEQEMQLIICDMKKLLTKIEDAVPLISLALTTSGAKLSTQLPSTVSPSRLLQASNLITAGDAQYTMSPDLVAQVGPTFTLSLYMLFAGYDRPETEEDMRETTWKEVIHKARVKLRRVPLDVVLSTDSGSDALQSHEISSSQVKPVPEGSQSHMRADAKADEFAYQLMVVEDFDDDRHHDFENDGTHPGPFDDIPMAGIREMIPVHEISKIFYADTSKVLNIGMDAESNHPVLLLRRDVQAVAPRRMLPEEQHQHEAATANNYGDSTDDRKAKTKEEKQHVEEEFADRKPDPWRLPPSLDPEWMALEVYTEAEDSDEELDEDAEGADHDFHTPDQGRESSQLSLSLSTLQINSDHTVPDSASTPTRPQQKQPWIPQLPTTLSMLELLLRLTSLQQFQQQSHLSIPDELLNFFLEESASTGAGGDEHHRQAIRADARRRVGWDPYDESPLKRRGEDYQYRPYYDSPGQQSNFRQSYGGSVASPGPPEEQSMNRTSRGLKTQTRSITRTPESRQRGTPASPSSHYKSVTTANRPEWLRGPDESRGGSPLRPAMAGVHSDEGLGTSPASMIDGQK